jgi:capsule polysaccharide export protein KpsE/RkpR
MDDRDFDTRREPDVDDVRSSFSGKVKASDRLFWTLMVMVAIYMVIILSGCYVTLSLTPRSPSEAVGNVMNGLPHDSQSVPETTNVTGTPEGLD